MGEGNRTSRRGRERSRRRSPSAGAARAGTLLVLSIVAAVAPQARAGDLEIVSKVSWESSGRKFVQPCVKNNSAERREARFRLGARSVYWSFAPLPVDAGQVTCFTLDSPVLIKGVDNDVELE